MAISSAFKAIKGDLSKVKAVSEEDLVTGASGDFIELIVRLPGTVTAVVIKSQKQVSAQDVINLLVRDYYLQDPDSRQMVIGPSQEEPGRIIKATDLILGRRHGDILEMWLEPRFAVAVCGTVAISNQKKILLDFRTPLACMMTVFKRVFAVEGEEEVAFKMLSLDATDPTAAVPLGQWLNSSASLAAQGFQPENHKLLIYLLDAYVRQVSPSSITGVFQGTLYDQTIPSSATLPPQGTHSDEQKLKETKKQKRWFVLKDRCLLSLDTDGTIRKGKPKTSVIIALEYYNAKLRTRRIVGKDGKPIMHHAIVLKRTTGFTTGNVQDHIITVADADDEGTLLKQWFGLIKERCIDVGTTRVFGVDIKELNSREERKSPIPKILTDCISYLDCFGLEVEGIFRKSGSASLVEYFRDQYDQGLSVSLKNCPDSHIVATLMKTYLRELPEPLLTFEAYDKLISVTESAYDKVQQAEQIFQLVATLPDENQIILQYLCSFLSRVSANSELNMMGPSSIATCFGPNLLRAKEEDMETMLHHTTVVNTITEILVTNPNKFSIISPQQTPPSTPGQTPHNQSPVLQTTFSSAQPTARAAQSRIQDGSASPKTLGSARKPEPVISSSTATANPLSISNSPKEVSPLQNMPSPIALPGLANISPLQSLNNSNNKPQPVLGSPPKSPSVPSPSKTVIPPSTPPPPPHNTNNSNSNNNNNNSIVAPTSSIKPPLPSSPSPAAKAQQDTRIKELEQRLAEEVNSRQIFQNRMLQLSQRMAILLTSCFQGADNENFQHLQEANQILQGLQQLSEQLINSQ